MQLINRIKGIIKFILFIMIFTIVMGVIISFIFPLTYRDDITRYSEIYDLDPFLVAAVIKVESGFNKDAVSRRDARGLMQIGPTTGQWAANVLGVDNYDTKMLYEPQLNIRFGTWYLRQLKEQFDEDIDLVLAAYNAGSGNVTRWLNDNRYSRDGENLTYIPFEETRNYLGKVSYNHKAYSFIYKKIMYMSDNDTTLYFDLIITIRGLLSKAYNSLT